MLYNKSREEKLSKELFQSPSSEYRSTPFWAWNDCLDKEELTRQIDIFKQMGFGGFHMHVRTGLTEPYLTPSFMDAVKTCVNKAKDSDMLAYLYDEDRWPSGSAGGMITKEHPEFARRNLLFTPNPYAPDMPHRSKTPEPGRGQENIRQDNGYLVGVYDITLDETGRMAKVDVHIVDRPPVDEALMAVKEEDFDAGTILPELPQVEEGAVRWYAYVEHATADPWFNNGAYIDTLNPAAIRAFLDSTHEKYAENFQAEFGKTIPSIFTDEPQFAPKKPLSFARERKDVFFPWTDLLPQLYEERFGEDILEHLPELFFEDGRRGSNYMSTRWQAQNLVTDRFVSSFLVQIGDWCEQHGIELTGHVMGEPTLDSQSMAVGDAMRCYPAFGIPGIDMLCDRREFTTAKQTQSMVRQCGKEGMLSELYGVTGWDYDFRGYKLQGDWQAALGVTLRVPHLSWLSMHGEAKRDYPASISYQSPWYTKYRLIEDHFARLNTALTRGKAVCRVGVIHPIESYWMLYGPGDQTLSHRQALEKRFESLTEKLLTNQIDFDFLNEASLPKQKASVLVRKDKTPLLKVGEMAYDYIIVPPVLSLRSTTVKLLREFADLGGKVVMQGADPDFVDAIEDVADETIRFYNKAGYVGNDEEKLLDLLEEVRYLDVRTSDGRRYDRLLYQLREDNGGKWLFLCQAFNPVSQDVDPSPRLRFVLNDKVKITEYDTMTGEIRPLAADVENGQTVFERVFHMHDSLLLYLEETDASDPEVPERTKASGQSFPAPDVVFGKVPITLEEPNMLLFDLAEYKVNDGPWQSEEEILRIDNAARRIAGIAPRLKEVAQPYVIRETPPKDKLKLRFTFESELEVMGALLAMEKPEEAAVSLNGEAVSGTVTGYFVDRCIKTVPLPVIQPGTNVIEITVPFGEKTDIEDCYLLGDFGVRIQGTKKILTAPQKQLGFGDITGQGLPFYTGNILYHLTVDAPTGSFTIRVPQYRGGLTEVLVDGESKGEIVFSPYALNVKTAPGEHEVAVRLYGTRQNGFAQLHHTQGVYFYQSPNSWRSAGDLWTYEYQLKPAGILKSPELYGARILDPGKKTRSAVSPEGAVEHS